MNTSAISLRRFAASALWLALLCAGCAAAQGAETLNDEWAVVRMGGARIGYVHTVTRKTDAPEPLILTSVFSESRLKRLGLSMVVRTAVEYKETKSGAVREVSSRTSASQMDTVSRGVVKGDRMEIEISTPGHTQKTRIPWDGAILGPHAQTQLIRESGLKAGAELSFKTFLPEFQRVAKSDLVVAGRETITINDQPLELWRGTMTQDILPGVPTEVWMDDEGNIIRTVTYVLGEVETLRATRDEALASIVPEEVAEVMARFFIPSNVRIASPRLATEVLYRIEGPADILEPLELDSRRQSVVERTPGLIRLRVRAVGDAEMPADAAPGDEFLAASPYLQSGDPEIVALAEQAVRGVEGRAAQADALTTWVYENITQKDLSVGFASAKETAASRQGDCSEHAVLLAAMMRARGIPSRVAVGVVYWQGVFGYHMWTEAFLNDWTAFDATLGAGVVDATHIKFADSPLDTPTPAGPFLSLVRVVGAISLTVEELLPPEAK